MSVLLSSRSGTVAANRMVLSLPFAEQFSPKSVPLCFCPLCVLGHLDGLQAAAAGTAVSVGAPEVEMELHLGARSDFKMNFPSACLAA